MTDHEKHQFLTPPEIAKLLRVSPHKVLNWIRKGELRAFNVGIAHRPRYRINREYLDEFLKLREVQQPPKPTRRRRKVRCPEGGPIDPELGEKLLKKGEATKIGNKYYRVWNGLILRY